MRNLYTEKVLDKFNTALAEARAEVLNGWDRVTISNSNSKMGEVASVSLMPYLTCPACKGTCGPACYAANIANRYKNVLRSYARNTALAIYKPATYWAQVNEAMAGVRFFRFHVAGDILTEGYFDEMVEACKRNPHCEVLCFTKRYAYVNAWMDENGDLPGNLHILFSGWSNLAPTNPHNLPETNVYDDQHPKAEEWLECGGNCFQCGCRGLGCWQAKRGDVVAFKMH